MKVLNLSSYCMSMSLPKNVETVVGSTEVVTLENYGIDEDTLET